MACIAKKLYASVSILTIITPLIIITVNIIMLMNVVIIVINVNLPELSGMNGDAMHTMPPNAWKMNSGHLRPNLQVK